MAEECADCLDPSLPTTYPQWRIQLAMGCLVVGATMCIIALSMLLIQLRRSDLRGRDPILMGFMVAGMFACLYAPIRDIISEPRSPCMAQLVTGAISRLCLGAVHLVRAIRVLSLHALQQRATAVLRERESTGAASSGSKHRHGTVFLSPTRHAGASSINASRRNLLVGQRSFLVVTPPGTEINDADNDESESSGAKASSSTPGTSGPHTPPTSTVRSVVVHPRALGMQHFALWLVDTFKPHSATGQVLGMMLLAVPLLGGVLHRSVSDHQVAFYGMGCTEMDIDFQIFCVYSVITLCVQIIVLVKLIGRTDAFKLREEMAYILLLQCLQVVAQTPIIPQIDSVAKLSHVFMYVTMWLSWPLVVVVFIMPVCRRTRIVPASQSQLQEQPLRPLELSLNVTTNNNANPRMAYPAANIAMSSLSLRRLRDPHEEEVVTAYDGATEEASENFSNLQFRRENETPRYLGSLLRYYTKYSSDGCCASVLAVKVDIIGLLQAGANTYGISELERLTVYMAFHPDSRALLPSIFSCDFCVEALLLLVDLDSFCRLSSALELKWGSFIRAMQRTAAAHAGESDTVLAQLVTSKPDFRNAEKELSELYFASTRAVELLFKLYLRPASQLRVELQNHIVVSASQMLDTFCQSWLSVHQAVWFAPPKRYNDLLEQCQAFSRQGLVQFGALFDEVENSVIISLAKGPILRFTSTPRFEDWKKVTRRKLWSSMPTTCKRRMSTMLTRQSILVSDTAQ
jgi:hypothetical protein